MVVSSQNVPLTQTFLPVGLLPSSRPRFLTDGPVKKSQSLRSVLTHALCHLIAAMDDICPQVH
jgi:hypothetical protein